MEGKQLMEAFQPKTVHFIKSHPSKIDDSDDRGRDGHAGDPETHLSWDRVVERQEILGDSSGAWPSDEHLDSDYDPEIDAITSQFSSHEL
jgi:hypothetical protein